MKKILTILLCCVYVTACSSATINLHYCMGKFIGWDIKPVAAAKCANCGMQKENKKGCCNDEHKTLQLKKDHIVSGNLEVAHNYFSYSVKPVSAFILPSFFNNAEVIHLINIPPLIQAVPAFIFHCVIRV